MATESLRMSPAAALVVGGGGFEDFEREQPLQSGAALDRERGLSMYRSGSAPPTVEGARAAAGSLFGHPSLPKGAGLLGTGEGLTEEDMRSHPSYLSYYYSGESMNPRLPPPIVSKEDWRAARRLHGFGGIGDERKKKDISNAVWMGGGGGGDNSLFSLQPGLSPRNKERELAELRSLGQWSSSRKQPAEKGASGLSGPPGFGLGARRKSFADAVQEEYGCSSYTSGNLLRPKSRNTFNNTADPSGVIDSQTMQLDNGFNAIDDVRSASHAPSLTRVRSVGSSISHSFSSSLAHTFRTDRPPIGRSPSPRLPPIGGKHCDADKSILQEPNCLQATSHVTDCVDDALVSLSSLNLGNNLKEDVEYQMESSLHRERADRAGILLNISTDPSQYSKQIVINESEGEVTDISISSNAFRPYEFSDNNGVLSDLELSKLASGGQINTQKHSLAGNLHNATHSLDSNSLHGYSSQQVADMQHIQRLPAVLNNHPVIGDGAEGRYGNQSRDQMTSSFRMPIIDPLYAQYAPRASDSPTQSNSRLDSSIGMNYLDSNMDFSTYQKAYLDAIIAQQRMQCGIPFVSKSGDLSHGLYEGTDFGIGMSYQGNSISKSILPSLGSGNSFRQNERLPLFPSMISGAGQSGTWSSENGTIEEHFSPSLLEEFKTNKNRAFELSDIAPQIVAFSMDQYGSRFIQQKLETASVEDMNIIFPKILANARALIKDVFGNYVIQKFLEHGTDFQRKQIASQLIGHVLSLSLHMYGCRVIQKALEVVDVELQTQMVLELDGSIMKCIHDQNGNHVIQKCIQCVPQERIQFVISTFYGQVVTLSTHPYGCRVIQRVLEHCDDAKTQSIMMEEILQSVCNLAQDQYGNYVVQHVLQQGKPEERSAIISKLSGQIVRMSQQKFASNVIEKCLVHARPDERQVLINEMLGSNEENQPLQAMMKDQFGNYVVQKVLETCNDRNRELILSRIKVHLNTLKKYTYGKHIVARVEKLITTGERHIGMSPVSS